MPANMLIFDAEYVSELTSRMHLACELMAEAVSSLKSAQNHENWKCKERTRILDDFDELNTKLGRLDSGVNETTRILSGSVSRFAALESQYESQAEGLSDELTANHGYAASVRTDDQPSQPQAGSSAEQSGADSAAGGAESAATTAAGATGAAGGAGAAGASGGRHGAGAAGPAAGGRHGAGVAGAMAGQIAGRGRPGNREAESGQPSGGPVSGGAVPMNINLPVTHIPDTPDAAARGTRDTRAVAKAAVNMTVHTITLAFAGEIPTDAAGLAEAYNAGRRVFENSAIIIASPAQAHTTERLAMATGIMNLAGNSSSGLGQAASQAARAASSGGNIRTKAQNMLSSFQGNSEAGELRNVLGVLAGSSSDSVMASSSGGSGGSGGSKSFFEEIVEELKKVISGEGSGVSSASSDSSPVTEFLNNFVMDQV